jgi:hypothetical protein
MADTLEIKKAKLELARIQYARMEYELKIEERLQEIDRLKEAVEKQTLAEADVQKKIQELEK